LLDHARTRTTCIEVFELFFYRLYTYITLLLDVSLAHSNARSRAEPHARRFWFSRLRSQKWKYVSFFKNFF